MDDLTVHAPNGGEAWWFLDTLMHVKLSAVATAGALAVIEQLAPPGSATPLHRHDETDEHFYVLSGEVIFHGPAGIRICPAGSFVSVPRGTDHAFRVSDGSPARLLVISAPPHFEEFVRAVGTPSSTNDLPPAAAPPGPEDIQRLAAVGARYDVTLLGPPPAAT